MYAEQKESHLTGTIKHPNWVTIDIVAFDIHVDSAFRTTAMHGRPVLMLRRKLRQCVEFTA